MDSVLLDDVVKATEFYALLPALLRDALAKLLQRNGAIGASVFAVHVASTGMDTDMSSLDSKVQLPDSPMRSSPLAATR